MVTKMMRWRGAWPPLVLLPPSPSRFHVRLVVGSLRGAYCGGSSLLLVEVRWKGPRVAWPRRPVRRRNRTREVEAEERPGLGPVVRWDEEFLGECSLAANRDGGFHPWEISFAVVLANGIDGGTKDKLSILGTASLNLADFVSDAKEKETQFSIPLPLAGSNGESPLVLDLIVGLSELGMAQGSSEITQGTVVPAPSSPVHGAIHTEKDDVSSLMRKVKILTDIVSTRKSKKTCREDEGSEGRLSARSDDAEFTFDTDSGDDLDDFETEDGKSNVSIRKSFSYGSLASANYIGGSFYSQSRMSNEFDWVFYSHRKSDVGCSQIEEAMPSFTEQCAQQTSKRSILPWRKRKLSFRTPKVRGVPLLNKDYGEEGGDDIDFDRRQMSSSDESLGRQRGDEDSTAPRSSVSDFGDDNFIVGTWETKEVVSRDGHMRISSQVFFASIDQRSERAAGEGACTVLVAVIADWFQNNRGIMPNQSQFDGLIRDGSLEWRKLCSNEVYQERFPDKHFDLETILQAGIRPLSVSPSKSFIGFFHTEDITEDDSTFGFLQGAMSFDNIWDEISQAGAENAPDEHPNLYIVSWNDHLFVLKVEPQAYYLIDTLGERLHEGCDRAYILKFDDNTVIRKMGPEEKAASKESGDRQKQQACMKMDQVVEGVRGIDETENEDILYRGKESCREYIKNFLAAIPIRELQADIKKGKIGATAIHQRLQIEFHYVLLPLQQSL